MISHHSTAQRACVCPKVLCQVVWACMNNNFQLADHENISFAGDFHLLRADLCMDVGQSLNPAIDIGQVNCLGLLNPSLLRTPSFWLIRQKIG